MTHKEVTKPAGWFQKNLGEVAKLDRQNIKPEFISSGTLYIGLEHINNDGGFNDFQIVEPGDLASNKFSFTKNHVLYGKLRPYLKKIARPDFSGICSTDIIPILPSQEIDKDFLFYYLRQPQYIDLATTRSSGANLPRISPKELEKFPIVFPPIAQQKRIAAILDKADAVRRKRREAIRLTEELLRSTFLEMFGDPITNPKGWKVRTLQSVCSRVTVGYVGSMSSEYQESGIPWLRSLNVKRNYISFSDLKYVSNDFHQKLRKSSLKPGDVVIVRTGKSGVASVIPESLPIANCSDLIVITCDFDLINNFYLSEVLNVILGDRDGGQDLTGAIQKHFNIKRAQKMNIPLPDMQLQEHWRAIYQKHQVLLASLQSCVQESENLFDSFLQRAFTGNL